MAYNDAPNTNTNAEAVAQDSLLTGRIQSRMLELSARNTDDFAKLEGGEDSAMPFWNKTDLEKGAGDKVTFSVMAKPAGRGSRGEVALAGVESKIRLNTYTCQVDWFRDAVALTKKEIAFLSAGKNLRANVLKMLGEKMGMKRQHDMMHKLIRTTGATVLRPNDRATRDTITVTDTLSTSFLTTTKARLQRLGARPITNTKMSSGCPVNHFLAFIPQDPMSDLRNSGTFQNAQLQAAQRSDITNPLFNGTLPDWNAIKFWENIIVNEDSNDAQGSPLMPEAVLGAAITDIDDNESVNGSGYFLLGGDGTATNVDYFRDFPGYDYLFTQDQVAAPDSGSYYFWIVNASGSDVGKMCFYKYTGSANTGNRITAITERLHATTTGTYYKATVGNVTYANVSGHAVLGNVFTAAHPVGSYIIPANANGVPIARSFLFGRGAGLRATGEVEMNLIEQEWDYGMVKGRGYEGIWGQTVALDTLEVPRHYIVMESAAEIPGIPVASMPAA